VEPTGQKVSHLVHERGHPAGSKPGTRKEQIALRVNEALRDGIREFAAAGAPYW
jgi:hypothetical protein